MTARIRFKRIPLLLIVPALLLWAGTSSAARLAPPASGAYHSAHPHFGLRDDEPTAESILDFTQKAGKELVWSYISFHWDRGTAFPLDSCRLLRSKGIIPLVGIMPWSTLEQGKPEPVYTLSRLLKGEFDESLRRMADDAASLGFPIMMEFGPEVNGSWFPWNGVWNGRDEDDYGDPGCPDGPERFRDSFRRVVDIFRERGADNVTWVFHAAADGAPRESWNSLSYYYPGDRYVDWIGVSVYGRLSGRKAPRSFDEIMAKVYPGLASLSQTKPIAILELGVSEVPGKNDKAEWIAATMNSINSGKYPRVKAVAWWNKTHRPDGTRSHLEIDSSPQSLEAYRKGVANFTTIPVWE